MQSFTDNEVFIDVQEVRKAETNAQLVAENIATQLERRIAFRRAMKKALTTAMKFGAKGIRVRCAGRLGGAEMGRVETYREGRVPLHTLRADVGLRPGRSPHDGTASSASRSGSSRARCCSARRAASPRVMRMLSPKRTKFRKQQKGKNRGIAWRGTDVSFGDFALQATEPAASSPRGRSRRAVWRFSAT